MQVGTSNNVNPGGGTSFTSPGAHIGFMTYGPNHGWLGTLSPSLTTARIIAVGGTGVTYASAVLGGMTDDWTAMTGNVFLNENPATPTTFTARNGGRVDFDGVISGSGSVLVGNSIVEGDSTAAGIALNNNGTVVFAGINTYTGPTTVCGRETCTSTARSAPRARSPSARARPSADREPSRARSPFAGGILEAGQAGLGTLTLASSLTFNGPASIYFGGTLSDALGSPGLEISTANFLNTNGNPITINIANISSVGDYALIGYPSINPSGTNLFTLGTLPNRAVGTLAFNNGTGELDLDVTSLASYILWTGTASSSWDTTTTNWTIPGGQPTQYIDSPGDSVRFDDTAGTNNSVTINGADVHPANVNFANNNVTYTVSGTNAIADVTTGHTALQLTGTGTVILLNTNTFTGPTSIGRGYAAVGQRRGRQRRLHFHHQRHYRQRGPGL